MRYLLTLAFVLGMTSQAQAQFGWQYQPAEQIIRNSTPYYGYGGFAPRYYAGGFDCGYRAYDGYGGYGADRLGISTSYTWGSDGTSYMSTTFNW